MRAQSKHVKSARRRNPVAAMRQPSLFGGPDSSVEKKWQECTPYELLNALPSIEALGDAAINDVLNEHDMREIEDAYDEVQRHRNVARLEAQGIAPELAHALLHTDLWEQLTEAMDHFENECVEYIVNDFRASAADAIQFELTGEGIFDAFLEDFTHADKQVVADTLLDAVASSDSRYKPLRWLLKPAYKNRILGGLVKDALDDLDINDITVGPVAQRDHHQLWSTELDYNAQYHIDPSDWVGNLGFRLAEIVQLVQSFPIVEARVRRELDRGTPQVYIRPDWASSSRDYVVLRYAVTDTVYASIPIDTLNDQFKHVSYQQVDDVPIYTYSGSKHSIAGPSAKGMYVVDLQDPAQLRHESRELGHCVGNARYGYAEKVRAGTARIYSIRTESTKSKFTIEYDVPRRVIQQVKGNTNRIPEIEDEIRLVVEFLIEGLGCTPQEVLDARDLHRGISQMRSAGLDPFRPASTASRANATARTRKPRLTARARSAYRTHNL